MTEDEVKRSEAEKPRAPDELLEEPEFEEIVFVENGRLVTVRRPNPNYKPLRAGRRT